MDNDLLPDLLKAIDQQIASPETPYVGKTLTRLLKAGLPEDEARTQMAICLGEQMDEVLRTRRGFDENAYRARLAELPMDEEPDAGQ